MRERAQHAPHDVLQTHWPQLRGRVQERWSRLTNEWLGEVDGRRDRLAEKLREAYGVTEEDANRQVDEFIDTHWNALSANRMTPQPDVNAGERRSPGPTNIGEHGADTDIGTGTISPGGRKI